MLCQGWTVVVRRTGLGTTPQKSLCLLQELQAGPTKGSEPVSEAVGVITDEDWP
jgi:hypothetical protein